MGLGQGNRGYAMAALLVGMSVMAVLMSAAMPVWSTFTKREKEAELIWRGEQYARAVGLFQRKYANTFPPTVDILVEQRFLRKKYKDPMTGEDFLPIPAGGGMPPGSVAPPAGGFGRQVPAPGNGRQSPQTQQSFQGRVNGVGQFGQGGAFPGQTPRQGQTARPAQPAIGIQGVVSKSNETALKIYNGRTKYNEWAFVYLATTRQPGGQQRPGFGGPQRPGAGGQQRPGTGGGRAGPFQRGGSPFAPPSGTDRRPPVPGAPPMPRPPRN